MRMQGRVAIVTGASHPRGMGRATALALAREGADLVLTDIEVEGTQAIAEEIRASGRRALALRTDITREDQVQAVVAAALEEHGRIDVLVNNAGVTRLHPILEISAEEWDRILAVNLKGAFLCTKAVLPTMIRQRYGRIVSIASHVAEQGAGGVVGAHYAASKAGILGLMKTVARQMAPYGITSNAVAPGPIDTDFTRDYETPEQAFRRRSALVPKLPLGRLGEPREVAEAVLFLASDGASYITGEVLDVNGGLHID